MRRNKGLNAFVSRLYWHCHFIQKLESEPAIEMQNVHRGFDDVRAPTPRQGGRSSIGLAAFVSSLSGEDLLQVRSMVDGLLGCDNLSEMNLEQELMLQSQR